MSPPINLQIIVSGNRNADVSFHSVFYVARDVLVRLRTSSPLYSTSQPVGDVHCTETQTQAMRTQNANNNNNNNIPDRHIALLAIRACCMGHIYFVINDSRLKKD